MFELDIGISLGMLFVQKYTHSITNNTSITNFNFLIIQSIKLKNISSYVPSNENVRSLSVCSLSIQRKFRFHGVDRLQQNRKIVGRVLSSN